MARGPSKSHIKFYTISKIMMRSLQLACADCLSGDYKHYTGVIISKYNMDYGVIYCSTILYKYS